VASANVETVFSGAGRLSMKSHCLGPQLKRGTRFHTATHCIALQTETHREIQEGILVCTYTATQCALQHTATHCNTLQHTIQKGISSRHVHLIRAHIHCNLKRSSPWRSFLAIYVAGDKSFCHLYEKTKVHPTPYFFACLKFHSKMGNCLFVVYWKWPRFLCFFVFLSFLGTESPNQSRK